MTRVGIFMDADNMLPFWVGEKGAPNVPEPRAHYIQADDFEAVLSQVDALADGEGSVVFREAYGHWANTARALPASMMYHEYGYDLQHVPPLSREKQGAPRETAATPGSEGLKNAGDILLSVRAIMAASRRHALDTIIVGAADKDYHQLVTELKRLGKRVVCMAFPQTSQQAKLLLETFDDVLTLDPVPRWGELEKVQSPRYKGTKGQPVGAAARPPAVKRPPLAMQKRPKEPKAPAKIKDPFILARGLWALFDESAPLEQDLVGYSVLHQNVSRVEAETLVSRLAEGAHLVSAGDRFERPDGVEFDDWKRDVVRSLVEIVVDASFAKLDDPLRPPAERIDRVRDATKYRFQSLSMGIRIAIDDAVGRRAVDMADGTPPDEQN
jgi:hypothetical protein